MMYIDLWPLDAMNVGV